MSKFTNWNQCHRCCELQASQRKLPRHKPNHPSGGEKFPPHLPFSPSHLPSFFSPHWRPSISPHSSSSPDTSWWQPKSAPCDSFLLKSWLCYRVLDIVTHTVRIKYSATFSTWIILIGIVWYFGCYLFLHIVRIKKSATFSTILTPLSIGVLASGRRHLYSCRRWNWGVGDNSANYRRKNIVFKKWKI